MCGPRHDTLRITEHHGCLAEEAAEAPVRNISLRRVRLLLLSPCSDSGSWNCGKVGVGGSNGGRKARSVRAGPKS